MIRPVGIVSLVAVMCALPAMAADSVALNLVAVQASQESREQPHYDAALAPVRDALAGLSRKYDTFKKLKASNATCEFGEEYRLKVSEKFTVCIVPSEKDSKGRYKLLVRIEEQVKGPDGKMRKKDALRTTVSLAPETPYVLAGHRLKLAEGDLVIALVAR